MSHHPPQPSVGYSVNASPSSSASPSSRPEKSPVPRPSVSPGGPKFPPPIFQQDQTPSPSIRSPNVPSPSNGMKTGSPITHLSTPPGPPVFTSPVRPAAIPFRASPATPQPLAFSSGSSIPTSSPPPHFSNGLADLQHQVSDAGDDSVPVSEAPYVLFSAHKVFSLCFIWRKTKAVYFFCIIIFYCSRIMDTFIIFSSFLQG